MSRMHRFDWYARRSASRYPSFPRHDRRLRVEPLEDRRMLAVVTVDTNLDTVDFNDGVTSLREAVFATNLVGGADEIQFDFGHDGPEVIVLTLGELQVTDLLTITGSGAELLTIDASGNDPTPDEDLGDGSRIFNIDDGSSATSIDVEIRGLTLTGGDVTGDGGAIFSRENVLVSESSILENSASGDGGGMFLLSSETTIEDSSFSGNTAGDEGGGIFSSGEGSSLTIARSTISGNSTRGTEVFSDGAGLFLRDGSANIYDSHFADNSAEHRAGGARFYYASATIERTTFHNNESLRDWGGAIHSSGSEVSIDESMFYDNRANFVGISGSGGAILNENFGRSDGVMTITGSMIVGNSALRGGGVMNNFNAEMLIQGSTISGNMASRDGGGVMNILGGDLVIHDSEISGNTASQSGGGIQGGGTYGNLGTLTITASTVSSNSAAFGGGGISSKDRTIISESTIFGNSSGHDGGGILASDATILSSTISGNSANNNGGGIFTYRKSNRIAYSTIVNNTSNADISGSGSGGGLFARTGQLLIDHTIIAENTDPTMASPDMASTIGESLDVHFSLIGDNTGTGLTEAPVGFPDANGNLIGGTVHGVIDPLLGPLADNGGPTSTHALLPGSPAINRGDLSAVAGVGDVPEFDQRGSGFDRVFSGRIDIGAYELQEFSDLNLLVDTLADESDGDFSRFDLSLREAIERANANPVPDTIHFDPLLAGGTILLTMGELAITDSVEIVGLGVDELTIDASGNDPTPEENNGDGSRVFNIDDGDDSNHLVVAIHGLTLTGGDISGGRESGGGAILSRESLSVSFSTVSNNSSRYGGGISVLTFGDSTSSIEHTTVENNSVDTSVGAVRGGGIHFELRDSSQFEISSSTVSGNTAYAGGGIHGSARDFSTATMDSNVVANNVASYGGGIQFSATGSGDVTVSSSMISGNQQTSGQDGVYRGGGIFGTSGDNATVTIASNQIANNTSYIGGGLAINSRDDSSMMVRSNSIIENSGTEGGGVYINAGHSAEVVISSNTISLNTGGHGGGLNVSAFSDIPVTLHDNNITGNSAARGGGIHAGVGTPAGLIIEETTISGNTSKLEGGGIWVEARDSGEMTVESSTIAENSAGTEGGGIFFEADDWTTSAIETATISGNSAEIGGGIFIQARDQGVLSIDSSTISDNSATIGGGVYLFSIDDGDVQFASSTISGNAADQDGGGFYVRQFTSNPLVVQHSTITDNTADNDSNDDGIGGGFFMYGVPLQLNHAIVAGNLDNSGTVNEIAGIVNSNFSLIGFGGEFLGPLADNGGPTHTHMLLVGSPAIDMGDPNIASPPVYDQRGFAFDRIVGGQIDIGAVESGAVSADFNLDGEVSGFDFLLWQSGFGTTVSAVHSDGDTNIEFDAVALEAWELQYGLAAPIVPVVSALAIAEPSAASSLDSGELAEMALAVTLIEEADGTVAFSETVTHTPPPEFFYTEPIRGLESAAGPSSSDLVVISTPVDVENEDTEEPSLWEDAVDEVFASVFM